MAGLRYFVENFGGTVDWVPTYRAVDIWVAETNSRMAKITAPQGNVQVFRSGGEKPYAAYYGMTLYEGDTIMTGKTGQAILVVDEDKEIKLASNTIVMVSQLRQSIENSSQQTAFSLKAGKVFCNIKNKLTPGSRFEVLTSDAVLSVKGTKFFVGEESGETDVAVLEGTVMATTYVPVEDPSDGGRTGRASHCRDLGSSCVGDDQGGAAGDRSDFVAKHRPGH